MTTEEGKFDSAPQQSWLHDRARQYAMLMRLDKPVGIVLLLWPTLWALWIAAKGIPNLHVLLVFGIGVILMRSAGCVINDFADRDFDPHVDRTRNRPIAAGKVRPAEALVLFCVLALLAFGAVLTLNWLTIGLSVAGAALAASYPFAKRYTHLPQVHLGVAFGWSIPMAFAAQTNSLPAIAWVMLLVNVLWSVAYDTIYAMVDREDDLKVGVKSTAILFGDADRLIIAGMQLAMLGLLLLVGYWLALGTIYYACLLGAVLFGAYQQLLIRNYDRNLCLQAFKNNAWLGACIFFGIAGHYALNT